MTSEKDNELAALIAGHYGISDLENCTDSERVADIRALAAKINAAGLGPSSIRGMVNSEGIRQILGLGSLRSTWVTMSRDPAFPEAVVTEKLWNASEVRKYAKNREAGRAGSVGRPPNSSALKQ
ncbi:hypothetical protein [Arthrobacter sp. OV608]|uniref:hypothetical protein n=1 Tax=Arthrobacter sp. OV608 TaxID=1882768 RepID=UPI0008BBEDA6|nr:hypothetical protein [Arthrobacter sp. OV608]SEQ80519.1 hypothetical protein SAMN05444745_11171 [Arthrobacter sp. OV608]